MHKFSNGIVMFFLVLSVICLIAPIRTWAQDVVTSEEDPSAYDEENVIFTLDNVDNIHLFEGKTEEEINEIKKNNIYRVAKRSIMKNYSYFFEKNNISDNDLEKITELLSLMAMPDPTMPISSQDMKKIESECMEEIENVLGDNQYPSFLEYKESLPERHQIDGLNQSLPQGERLGVEKKEELINDMYKVRKDFEAEDYVSKDTEELNREYIDIARKHLSSEQLRVLEDNLQDALWLEQDMIGGGDKENDVE